MPVRRGFRLSGAEPAAPRRRPERPAPASCRSPGTRRRAPRRRRSYGGSGEADGGDVQTHGLPGRAADRSRLRREMTRRPGGTGGAMTSCRATCAEWWVPVRRAGPILSRLRPARAGSSRATRFRHSGPTSHRGTGLLRACGRGGTATLWSLAVSLDGAALRCWRRRLRPSGHWAGGWRHAGPTVGGRSPAVRSAAQRSGRWRVLPRCAAPRPASPPRTTGWTAADVAPCGQGRPSGRPRRAPPWTQRRQNHQQITEAPRGGPSGVTQP